MSIFEGRRGFSRGFRGGGRGGKTQISRADKELPAPLGAISSSLYLQDIEPTTCPVDQAKISGCEYVASYNIQRVRPSTILVPGAPPRWTPLERSEQLQEDQGEYLRDDNAARFPLYPMAPAITSLFTLKSDFDASSIDLVGCASTLGNLVRFVCGTHQDLGFVVHMLGDTAFFLRREMSPTDLLKDVRGYGHAFPEAYTSWDPDVKGSISHQRVVQYGFGGKRLLIRFESDGCLETEGEGTEMKTHDDQERPIDELLANLTAGRIADIHGSVYDNEAINVRLAGRVPPQASLFDLKTRTCFKKEQAGDILAGELPRLWIRQLSKFILAFHDRGRFDDIRVQDVSARVLQWESENQIKLRRLAVIIQKVIDAAEDSDSLKIEVRSSGLDTLELRHVPLDAGWNALPPELAAYWTIASDSENENDGLGVPLLDRDRHDSFANDGKIEAKEPDYTACTEDCGYCGWCCH